MAGEIRTARLIESEEPDTSRIARKEAYHHQRKSNRTHGKQKEQHFEIGSIDPQYKGGSEAVSINDRGQVLFFRNESQNSRAGDQCCIWDQGKVTLIPELSGKHNGTPIKINNRSQVLASLREKPVIWDKGKLTKIGNLPARLNAYGIPRRSGFGYDSDGRDMNDHGEVVGMGASTKRLNGLGFPDETGFLFSNGKLYDLRFNADISFRDFGCQDKTQLTRQWHDVFECIIKHSPGALAFWVIADGPSLHMCLPDADHLAEDHFIRPGDDTDFNWPFEFWQTYRVVLSKIPFVGGVEMGANLIEIFDDLKVMSLDCMIIEINDDYLSVSVKSRSVS